MLLILIIVGAVVSGGIMLFANNKAKQGVAWGQPVAIVFGIIAICFACWAIFENLMGKTDEQKAGEAWQVVRGKGIAKWINENCKDKKILVVLPPEGIKSDLVYDTVKGNLSGITTVEYHLPKPEQQDGPNPEMEMGPDGMDPFNPAKLSAQQKKLIDDMQKKYNDGIKGANADFDTVMFVTSVPNCFLFDGKMKKKLEVFKDKKFIFTYAVYGGDEQAKSIEKDPAFLACVVDKPLANEADYDKAPTGDQDKDFATRYEIKTAGK